MVKVECVYLLVNFYASGGDMRYHVILSLHLSLRPIITNKSCDAQLYIPSFELHGPVWDLTLLPTHRFSASRYSW